MSFRQVAVVEFDKAMEREIFLASGEIDDESGWDVSEGVEFVTFAEGDHVPDQALLVGEFAVELEMVEREALAAQLIELESEGILRPLEG
jgi:hypothetical protein